MASGQIWRPSNVVLRDSILKKCLYTEFCICLVICVFKVFCFSWDQSFSHRFFWYLKRNNSKKYNSLSAHWACTLTYSTWDWPQAWCTLSPSKLLAADVLLSWPNPYTWQECGGLFLTTCATKSFERWVILWVRFWDQTILLHHI